MSALDIAIRRFDVAGFLRNRASISELPYELNLDCLLCGGKQKMYVNKNSKRWLCHKCGERGGLTDLIESVAGLSLHEAVRLILDDRNKTTVLRRGRLNADSEIGPEIDYPEGFKFLSFPETRENKRFWKYLRSTKRGILPSVALDYKLGYCATGRYRNRVVVPVYWFDTLVTWVARSLSDDVERTKLTPFGNKQSNYLLNLDRLWGRDEIVLVEGPFDALKLPDVAVASFGKKISRKQVSLLTHANVKRVLIAYDNDALDATWATARILSKRFDVGVVTLPDGEDPGSLPELTTRQLLKEAIPYSPSAYFRFREGAAA